VITYYDWDHSPNCLKTKILLNELGIPYEQRSLDIAALRDAEYRAKFPSGQVPALEDGKLLISESGAIALYLAEKHNQLIPRDALRRARMYQAMSFESALLAPTVGGQGLFGELFKPEPERNQPRILELRTKAQRVGQILGAVLGAAEYFAEEFSIADIQLYAALSKSLEGRVFDDPPKNLVEWCARMSARPSVMKAREQYVHYRRQAA
jgi:glutathione S-transferase